MAIANSLSQSGRRGLWLCRIQKRKRWFMETSL